MEDSTDFIKNMLVGDIDAMNDYMVRKWNRKVKHNDEVVIIGDFSWGNAEETNKLLPVPRAVSLRSKAFTGFPSIGRAMSQHKPD